MSSCENLLQRISLPLVGGQLVPLHLPPVADALALNVAYTGPLQGQQEEPSVYGDSLLLPFASSPLARLPIEGARYLCKGNDVRTVIEISLKNKDNLIQFKAGDTIAILPQNCEMEVDYLIKRLNVVAQATEVYKLTLNSSKKAAIPPHLPVTGILRRTLMSCVDVRSVLKKTFICALSKYTHDPTEKRCLEELCSKEGCQLYAEHVLNRRMNIADLLKEYLSCKPPVALLLQHLPRLMPRPYSVCNSYDPQQNAIQFCFSVPQLNCHTKGLATGWMEKMTNEFLQENNSINNNCSEVQVILSKLQNISLTSKQNILLPVYLRKSSNFCLPPDKGKPIIMIALGTGVAPFIGFLSERQRLMNLNANKEFGKVSLYFGTRYYEKDFIYKNELTQFLSNGVLNKLRVSHSREIDSKAKYVQENLIEDAEDIVKAFDGDAVIFLCGDITKVAKNLSETLVQCLCLVKNLQHPEAEETVNSLKENNRIVQDIWS